MRDMIETLVDKACKLHQEERELTRRSLDLVFELDRLSAGPRLGLTQEELARRIGLTPAVMWKRLRVARLLRLHPEAWMLVEAGETCLSTLAMIAPKLTRENAAVLLDGIAGKSRRDAEIFASRVTKDGRVRDDEGACEIKLVLKASEVAILQRAREVLAAGGKVPSLTEVVVQAARQLVDRRDPMKKAERAKQRASAPGQTEEPSVKESTPQPMAERVAKASSAQGQASVRESIPQPVAERRTKASAPGQAGRPSIPAAVRHAVWLRDGGRCTWVGEGSGQRCEARAMLELDHVVPFCRGGSSDTAGLRLRCRFHNRAAAEDALGHEFMASKVDEVARRRQEHGA
jgi:hypothetical protein